LIVKYSQRLLILPNTVDGLYCVVFMRMR